MLHYNKNGICDDCGLPGTGFVEDGVCECADTSEFDYPIGGVLTDFDMEEHHV